MNSRSVFSYKTFGHTGWYYQLQPPQSLVSLSLLLTLNNTRLRPGPHYTPGNRVVETWNLTGFLMCNNTGKLITHLDSESLYKCISFLKPKTPQFPTLFCTRRRNSITGPKCAKTTHFSSTIYYVETLRTQSSEHLSYLRHWT